MWAKNKHELDPSLPWQLVEHAIGLNLSCCTGMHLKSDCEKRLRSALGLRPVRQEAGPYFSFPKIDADNSNNDADEKIVNFWCPKGHLAGFQHTLTAQAFYREELLKTGNFSNFEHSYELERRARLLALISRFGPPDDFLMDVIRQGGLKSIHDNHGISFTLASEYLAKSAGRQDIGWIDAVDCQLQRTNGLFSEFSFSDTEIRNSHGSKSVVNDLFDTVSNSRFSNDTVHYLHNDQGNWKATTQYRIATAKSAEGLFSNSLNRHQLRITSRFNVRQSLLLSVPANAENLILGYAA